jgi:hypothetical protein
VVSENSMDRLRFFKKRLCLANSIKAHNFDNAMIRNKPERFIPFTASKFLYVYPTKLRSLEFSIICNFQKKTYIRTSSVQKKKYMCISEMHINATDLGKWFKLLSYSWQHCQISPTIISISQVQLYY